MIYTIPANPGISRADLLHQYLRWVKNTLKMKSEREIDLFRLQKKSMISLNYLLRQQERFSCDQSACLAFIASHIQLISYYTLTMWLSRQVNFMNKYKCLENKGDMKVL